MRGRIAVARFSSGDRFFIGSWDDTPLGPFTDVMWARPDGARVLLVPDQPVADFITAVHSFDRAQIASVKVTSGDRFLELAAGPVEVQVRAGVGYRIPFARPPWVTRWIEAPIARAAFGVDAYSVTPRGVRRWYRTDEHRPITAGWATVDGRDLGALAPRSSINKVRPLLEDPNGRLDRFVRAAARQRARVTCG
jgi:hypothetical protein